MIKIFATYLLFVLCLYQANEMKSFFNNCLYSVGKIKVFEAKEKAILPFHDYNLTKS